MLQGMDLIEPAPDIGGEYFGFRNCSHVIGRNRNLFPSMANS